MYSPKVKNEKGKHSPDPRYTKAMETPQAFETEELNQDNIPNEIKAKTYLGPAAERELAADLEEYGVADDDKYIRLSGKGKAFREVPTKYHNAVIKKLDLMIRKTGGETLLTDRGAQIYTNSSTGRGKKYPDLAVWGEERVDEEEPKMITEAAGFRGEESMNPNVIIEFSWTNTLPEELMKLTKQMRDHFESLGQIKAGFLIKPIPLRGVALPPEDSSRDEIALIPLCGFDVYEIHAGGSAEVRPPTTPARYRVGINENVSITVSGNELDRGDESPGFTIQLSSLKECLIEKYGFVFQKEGTDEKCFRRLRRS